MTEYNFETPSRQSKKGILVFFTVSFYKVIKQLIVVLSIFLFRYISSDKPSEFSLIWVYVGFGLASIYLLVLSVLKYYNFKFHLTKDHFVLKNGILNKEEISIAKNKVQNIYIKQNLIQQLINVVSLSIETAGDDDTEIEIKAIEKDKAVVLKAELLKGESTSIKVEEVNTNNNIYYQVSFKNLLLEGITENHFRSFFIILIFLLGAYNDSKDFFKSLNTESRFQDYFNLNETEFLSLILFNLVLVIILLFVAFLFSLVKTVIKNFDLKVTKVKDGLEISKGLFNKLNLGLNPSRIQNVTIKTNRIKKKLGLYKFVFTQAMVNKKQQNNFNIIGLSQTKVKALTDRFYPNAIYNIKKHKPEYYYMFKIVIPYLGLILLLNVVLVFVDKTLIWVNIPVVILLILAVIYGYKKAYYSIDENYLVVGSGKFIDTNTDILELHKIQAVSLEQTIFEKRRQLATVKVNSASKELVIPSIKATQAKLIANYLLFKIESTSKSWM